MKKIGILGLGSIGLRHASILLRFGKRVIGFDPDNKAQSSLETIGGEAVSREEVLQESSAIIISTPNHCHLDDLAAAISHNKPVLVEKPLGHPFNEAVSIVHNAKDKEIPVFAAFNLRHRRVVNAFKKELDCLRAGKPISATFTCGSYLPTWRPQTDYSKGYAAHSGSGGVVYDNIHEVDLAIYLLGDAKLITGVLANSGLLDIESEDQAILVLQHQAGCIATILLDYVRRPAKRVIELVGTKGTLVADLREGSIEFSDLQGNREFIYHEAVERNGEYESQIRYFLDWSQSRSLLCSGEDALKSLEIVFEAKAKGILRS
jgi:predicted dehydrogenase